MRKYILYSKFHGQRHIRATRAPIRFYFVGGLVQFRIFRTSDINYVIENSKQFSRSEANKNISVLKQLRHIGQNLSEKP